MPSFDAPTKTRLAAEKRSLRKVLNALGLTEDVDYKVGITGHRAGTPHCFTTLAKTTTILTTTAPKLQEAGFIVRTADTDQFVTVTTGEAA